MTKPLLKVGEAATQLGLQPCTVRAWIARRKLPCVHCGRAVRVPSEAVEQFIERNTIPARESRRG
jgi:excisionase family DNA binding protein